jgi:hypothetical protein
MVKVPVCPRRGGTLGAGAWDDGVRSGAGRPEERAREVEQVLLMRE